MFARGNTWNSESRASSPGATRQPRDYPYDTLPPNHIRLLKLVRGETNDGLQGCLETVSFKRKEKLEESFKRPEYDALSYFWGRRPENKADYWINLIKNDTPYKMYIRENLASALRQLRSADEDKYLWVDAICIDQSVDSNLNENNEKNVQIPLMDIIYNRARNVCIWLGPAKDNSDEAMDFVDSILDLNIFDVFRKDPSAADKLANFAKLLNRDWFGRRWIVQELAVARSAFVYCGTKRVSWPKFAGAISLFSSKHVKHKEIFQESNAHGNDPEYLGDVRQLGAFTLVHAASNFFQKSDDGEILDKLVTLEEVISTLTTFDAKDPRDIVYAVLSLAADATASVKEKSAYAIVPEKLDNVYNELVAHAEARDGPRSRPSSPLLSRAPEGNDVEHQPQEPSVRRVSSDWRIRNAFSQGTQALLGPLQSDKIITIRYKSSVFDVYRDFIEHTVSRSRSIDILCRPWAVDPVDGGPGLPSWIPRRSKAVYGFRQNRAFSRIRADLLVGSASTEGKHYYSASKNSRTIFDYRNHNVLDRSLVVKGFVLDTIRTIFFPAMGGIIPSEWYDVWKATTRSEKDSAFWRTLVADRGLEGQKPPPSYYELACKHAFDRRVNQGQGYLDTRDMVKDCPSIVEEYLQRVQAVTWMRRLIITKAQNRLGLVPYDAKKRDLVCILQGCSVPIILRRHETITWVQHRLDKLPSESAPPKIVLPDTDSQMETMAINLNEAFGGEGHGNYSDPSRTSTATERAAYEIAERNRISKLRKDLNDAVIEIGLRRISLVPEQKQISKSATGFTGAAKAMILQKPPPGRANGEPHSLKSSEGDTRSAPPASRLTHEAATVGLTPQPGNSDMNASVPEGGRDQNNEKESEKRPLESNSAHTSEKVYRKPTVEDAKDEDPPNAHSTKLTDESESYFEINNDRVDAPPSESFTPTPRKTVQINGATPHSSLGVDEASRRRDPPIKNDDTIPNGQPTNNVASNTVANAEIRLLNKTDRQLSWQRQTIPRYFYEFIGECYIHGMMDGEASKIPKAAYPTEEVFDPHQGDPQVFWLSQESAVLREMGF